MSATHPDKIETPGLTCKREQLRRRSTSARKLGSGWSWRTIGHRGGRRGYPAVGGGGGGSKKGRVWGSKLPLAEGEFATRRPAGAIAGAGEGHQGTGATDAMYGMARALIAGEDRGGRGGCRRLFPPGSLLGRLLGLGSTAREGRGRGGGDEGEGEGEAAVIYVGGWACGSLQRRRRRDTV